MMDDYFKDHGRISNSALSLLKRSPELYHRRYIAGVWDDEETDAMKLGSLVHCLVLEKHTLDERYAIAPKVDRRTKKGKATWAGFVADSQGKTLVDQEQFDEACIMAANIEKHEAVAPLLSIDYYAEHVIKFEFEGLLAKCKQDYLAKSGQVVLDIKTTKDASPEEFARSVAVYGYHRQAAFYRHAVEQTFGVVPRFVFACVQSSDPYLVACYELDEAAIDVGRIELCGLVEELNQRHASNDWSSEFTKGINVLSLPRWYS